LGFDAQGENKEQKQKQKKKGFSHLFLKEKRLSSSAGISADLAQHLQRFQLPVFFGVISPEGL
jgi:hypothetical protein